MGSNWFFFFIIIIWWTKTEASSYEGLSAVLNLRKTINPAAFPMGPFISVIGCYDLVTKIEVSISEDLSAFFDLRKTYILQREPSSHSWWGPIDFSNISYHNLVNEN